MFNKLPMTDKMERALSEARVNVTLASSMLSYQMFKCDIFYTDDPIIKTAGAIVLKNRNVIAINPEWWLNTLKDTKERAFVLLHEVLHIFLDHGSRRVEMGYIHNIHNLATDYNINPTCKGESKDSNGNIITNERYAQYVSMPVSGGLYEKKWVGVSSDQIYKEMIEDLEKQGIDPNGYDGGGFDDVLDPEEDVTAQVRRNIQTAIASIEHAKQTNGIGDNELSLVKRFYELATPKIKWTERISVQIERSIQLYTTYNRISRRSGEICFPTYQGEHVKVFYGIDSSGSMSSKDTKDSLTELYGLLQQYDSWEIDVYTCDASAHLIGEFNSDEHPSFLDNGIDIIGGGGTKMEVMLNQCEDLVYSGEKEYNICIIATDGFIPLCDDITISIPSVFVVTENGNKNLRMVNSEVIHVN